MPGLVTEEQKLEMPNDVNKNQENNPNDFWAPKNSEALNEKLETRTTEMPKEQEKQNNPETTIKVPEASNLSSEQTEEIKKKTEETLETLEKVRGELEQEHDELVTYEKQYDDEIASKDKELKELRFRQGLITDMRKKLEDQAKKLGIDLGKKETNDVNDSIENKFRSSNLQ